MLRILFTISLLAAFLNGSATDFALLSVKSPSGFAIGGKMQIQTTYSGVVDQPTGKTVEIFYSKDSLWSSDDLLLYNFFPYMNWSGEVTWPNAVTLPSNAVSGEYIVVVLDRKNEVVETNENNNSGFLKIGNIVQAIQDLSLSARQDTVFLPYETYQQSVDINNYQSIYIESKFTISTYFSVDHTWDSGDTLIGSRSSTWTFDPQSYYDYYSYYFTPKAAPGKYFVITKVEFTSPADVNLQNNILITPVSLIAKKADLVIASLKQINHVASKGDTSRFALQFGNIGQTKFISGDSILYNFYLTASPELSANDIILGRGKIRMNYQVPDLIIPIPANWEGNTAYLHVTSSLKPIDGVQETDLSNNSKVLKIDLSLALPDAGFAEGSNQRFFRTNAFIDVVNVKNDGDYSFRIYNFGNTILSKAKILFFFSSDTLLDTQDTRLKDTLVTLQKQSNIYYTPLLEGLNLPLGKNYILVVADSANAISEFSETNNLYYFEYIKSAPKAEFSYESVTIDNFQHDLPFNEKTLHKKQDDSIRVSLYTIGSSIGVETSKPEVGIYFSEDLQFDQTQDQLLAIFQSKGGAGNNSYIPLNSINASKGYILVMIDPKQQFEEYTRTNNLTIYPIIFSQITAVQKEINNATLVHPNPCIDVINFANEYEEASILNSYGQVMTTIKNDNKLMMTTYPSGVYFLRLRNLEGTQVFKIMKE